MNDDRASEWAQAIADGRRPDFESAPGDDPRLHALRLLNDIAESFRRSGATEPPARTSDAR